MIFIGYTQQRHLLKSLSLSVEKHAQIRRINFQWYFYKEIWQAFTWINFNDRIFQKANVLHPNQVFTIHHEKDYSEIFALLLQFLLFVRVNHQRRAEWHVQFMAKQFRVLQLHMAVAASVGLLNSRRSSTGWAAARACGCACSHRWHVWSRHYRNTAPCASSRRSPWYFYICTTPMYSISSYWITLLSYHLKWKSAYLILCQGTCMKSWKPYSTMLTGQTSGALLIWIPNSFKQEINT